MPFCLHSQAGPVRPWFPDQPQLRYFPPEAANSYARAPTPSFYGGEVPLVMHDTSIPSLHRDGPPLMPAPPPLWVGTYDYAAASTSGSGVLPSLSVSPVVAVEPRRFPTTDTTRPGPELQSAGPQPSPALFTLKRHRGSEWEPTHTVSQYRLLQTGPPHPNSFSPELFLPPMDPRG